MSLSTVLLREGRKIGAIIPDVVIEEVHTDTLTITDHPVDQGADITDHAFVNPAELTMRIGWSNQSLALNGVISGIVSGSIFKEGPKLKTVKDVYEALLKLQAQRKRFDVVTGKRAYKDMLIKGLSVTTKNDTENALICVVNLRQVIVVQTSNAKLKKEAQKTPEKTAPMVELGLVQPSMANTLGGVLKFIPVLGQ